MLLLKKQGAEQLMKGLDFKKEVTMAVFNERFLPILEKHIEEIRKQGKQEFSTVDLIQEYIKHYNVDRTSPNESINANIGKFLKENDTILGIKKIASNQSVKDDNGNVTSTSIWKFV